MSDRSVSSEQIVLPDSPEAATYRTDIKGWVSRDGRFYGDGPTGERTARYAGSTHSVCQRCQKPCEKNWLLCDGCRSLADHERWEKLELVEWDGVTPLTLFRGDEYFFDADSIYEYAYANDLKVSELDLVVCVPNCARRVESDYWEDHLPEDGDLPSWLSDAIQQLNEVIEEHRSEPLSWSDGKKRVVLPDIQETAS